MEYLLDTIITSYLTGIFIVLWEVTKHYYALVLFLLFLSMTILFYRATLKEHKRDMED